MFKSNISQGDKLIRITLSISLAIIGYFTAVYWLLIIAAIVLVTALINFCPIYTIFGFSTKKTHPSPFKPKGKHKK